MFDETKIEMMAKALASARKEAERAKMSLDYRKYLEEMDSYYDDGRADDAN